MEVRIFNKNHGDNPHQSVYTEDHRKQAVLQGLKDREVLMTFYDFPATHWQHLRTTNPIESTFSTIRHSTVRAKGCVTRDSMSEHDVQALRMCREKLAQATRLRVPLHSHSYWLYDKPDRTRIEQVCLYELLITFQCRPGTRAAPVRVAAMCRRRTARHKPGLPVWNAVSRKTPISSARSMY